MFGAADRQVQIVELDGLQLLLPLTKSKDTEVQRLAAHALANLSVNCKKCFSSWLVPGFEWSRLIKRVLFCSCFAV